MQISNRHKTFYTSFKALPKFQRIVDNRLVRGSYVISPLTLQKMKKDGITQIIDLRNTSFLGKIIEQFFCKILGIKYLNHKYPHRINKLPPAAFFNQINQDIIQNQGKTYIHCLKGKRRTGVCVAIYELTYGNKTKKEILDDVLNLGFTEIRDNIQSRKFPYLKSVFEDLMKRYFNN